MLIQIISETKDDEKILGAKNSTFALDKEEGSGDSGYYRFDTDSEFTRDITLYIKKGE